MTKYPTRAHELAERLALMLEEARFRHCTGVDDRKHAVQASRSAARNVAEGYALGPYGRYLLLVASGGAAEARTCARLGQVDGVDELVEQLQEEIENLVQRADRLAADNATRKADLATRHRPLRYSFKNPRKAASHRRLPRPNNIARLGGGRFPDGYPGDFRFDSPSGLPRNLDDWSFLRAWLADWGERIRRAERIRRSKYDDPDDGDNQ